jgi:hypothetical protein
MSDNVDSVTLVAELVELALQLEDYDPPGAFSLREEAGFFTEIPFRLPVHLNSGRVSLIEALKLSHGAPAGRFLLATGATPNPSKSALKSACAERTVQACLHGLDWRGAELSVRCDPRELSPEVKASIGQSLALETRKHEDEAASEFLLPWRRLPTRGPSHSEAGSHEVQDPPSIAAAETLGLASSLDLYETALLAIFPTACASRGLKLDDCTALVRGRGSWAFRVAESIQASFGSPVRVELAGRRYRPAANRAAPTYSQRGSQGQGRWETDEKDSSSQPEVTVLLGGTEPIDTLNSADVKSCLLFQVNRETLTPGGENALREKGIVVVPHLLLCSIEVLAADSLADDDLSLSIAQSGTEELSTLGAELRSGWRQRLLAAWERVLARTKEEQCGAREAAVRIAAEALVQASRGRLGAAKESPVSPEEPPPAPLP